MPPATTSASGMAMASTVPRMASPPHITGVHGAAIAARGTLFAARGALVQAGRPGWAMAAPLRWLSITIDTVLLTAALMLLTLLPAALFANGWLTLKLVLVVAYVGLGTLALRRGRTARVRRGCFVAALVAYAAIIGIARAHHPLGWLLPWLG